MINLSIRLLAASRVYLLAVSLLLTVSSYLTHFTLARLRQDYGRRYCFCGTFPKISLGRR